ncbi:winged helix-turn-helix domain-containing protein [Pseudoramibacter porci]|uniref:Stage 0 sporulation protein A homolog n=1 Tax=Pseudoramibacter porci TaxID=2606631 RepID=A0A7X2NF61_9FIRM|nr:response regulator transcription factor [Pseudoramibacter porci]MSS19280.1 response regulator transcription factor [Pseudoramibacter porci]
MRIFCVEDDNSIRELVVYTLNHSGYEAQGFESAEPFWQAMAESQQSGPDLLLLDIMLPGQDGLSILKQLRAQTQTAALPVIMLTAKGEEVDKVMGLDAGADDYVAKPFGMMELLARIKAVARRAGVDHKTDESDEAMIDGPIVIHPKAHTVQVDGQFIQLTLKEYDLLSVLMRHAGNVMTRDALLTDIWGYDFDGETRTVDVHVRTLRQKLGTARKMIETVRGVGYRMRKEANFQK